MAIRWMLMTIQRFRFCLIDSSALTGARTPKPMKKIPSARMTLIPRMECDEEDPQRENDLDPQDGVIERPGDAGSGDHNEHPDARQDEQGDDYPDHPAEPGDDPAHQLFGRLGGM